LDKSQLITTEPPLPLRQIVKWEPKEEPNKSGQTGDYKCRLPAPSERNPRKNDWRYDRPNICARIKQAGSEGSLLLGEPQRNGFN